MRQDMLKLYLAHVPQTSIKEVVVQQIQRVRETDRHSCLTQTEEQRMAAEVCIDHELLLVNGLLVND